MIWIISSDITLLVNIRSDEEKFTLGSEFWPINIEITSIHQFQLNFLSLNTLIKQKYTKFESAKIFQRGKNYTYKSHVNFLLIIYVLKVSRYVCIVIFCKRNIDQFLDVDWSPGHINIISLKLFQICRIDTLKVSTGNPSNINLE